MYKTLKYSITAGGETAVVRGVLIFFPGGRVVTIDGSNRLNARNPFEIELSINLIAAIREFYAKNIVKISPSNEKFDMRSRITFNINAKISNFFFQLHNKKMFSVYGPFSLFQDNFFSYQVSRNAIVLLRRVV